MTPEATHDLTTCKQRSRADPCRRALPRVSWASTDRSGHLPRLPRLAWAIAGATGWRRTLLALPLGAVAVLALPPVYIVPALVPAFTGLLWLLDGARTWRTALLIGFLFGLGYFTAGLYWVANALLTKPEEFGWLAPLAPIGLAAILAPFPAIACALTRLAQRPVLVAC